MSQLGLLIILVATGIGMLIMVFFGDRRFRRFIEYLDWKKSLSKEDGYLWVKWVSSHGKEWMEWYTKRLLPLIESGKFDYKAKLKELKK